MACGVDDMWVRSDPLDCKGYFVCSLGTIEHLACPEGLEFSGSGMVSKKVLTFPNLIFIV